jgi:hypothetical protein
MPGQPPRCDELHGQHRDRRSERDARSRSGRRVCQIRHEASSRSSRTSRRRRSSSPCPTDTPASTDAGRQRRSAPSTARERHPSRDRPAPYKTAEQDLPCATRWRESSARPEVSPARWFRVGERAFPPECGPRRAGRSRPPQATRCHRRAPKPAGSQRIDGPVVPTIRDLLADFINPYRDKAKTALEQGDMGHQRYRARRVV